VTAAGTGTPEDFFLHFVIADPSTAENSLWLFTNTYFSHWFYFSFQHFNQFSKPGFYAAVYHVFN